MSEIRRLIGVFWEPGAAFADIIRGPRWWIPMLLLIAAALVYTTMLSQRIGWERVIRDAAASSEQFQSMPAADRERMIAQQAKFVGVIGYAGAVLGTPLSVLVIAGVVTLLFSLFLGGQAKFGQIFGIVAYTQLLSLISLAAMITLLFLKAPEDFNVQNPVGFNVGFYLGPDSAPKWLISLASSIDLMSFWYLALVAIGLRAADPRASRAKAFAAVLIPWAVYVAGKTAIAAIRG